MACLGAQDRSRRGRQGLIFAGKWSFESRSLYIFFSFLVCISPANNSMYKVVKPPCKQAEPNALHVSVPHAYRLAQKTSTES